MPQLVLSSFRLPSADIAISRVSIAGNGQANGQSESAHISANGRYVVFESNANNLIAGDTNGRQDIFRKDLWTGEILRVSETRNEAGEIVQTNLNSFAPSISADGRYVLFESEASNLVEDDTNGARDIFRKDLFTGEIERVSTAASGDQTDRLSGGAHISADGRFVVFGSYATNLVAGDTNGRWDIFRKDLATNELVRISTTSSSAQANGNALAPAISADGRYAVFYSEADNLADSDANGTGNDIFRKDLTSGELIHVSTSSDGVGGNGPSVGAAISADDRYVVFHSSASNLVEDDANGTWDIFRKDLLTGEIVRVSTATDGAESNGESRNASISADGRYVVFESSASNLVEGDSSGERNIFRKDLVTGEIVCLTAAFGAPSNGESRTPAISPDGRYVAFVSEASNLAAGDTNGIFDVFVFDTAWLPLAPAIVENRYVQLRFETGAAHQVSLAWGDGSTDTVLPSDGLAGFSHAYATPGLKQALATVQDGSLTWVVPYRIDLAGGLMSRDFSQADTLTGSGANETLTGDGFANRLCGESGKDRLFGDDGNDVLYGGFGNDRLAGGAGKDVFAFDSRILPTTKKNQKKNFDTLTDFKRAEDDLWLDNGIFTRLGKKGSADNPQKLKKAFFTLGTEAKDANDFLVYDRKKGILYYDKDGSGEAEAVAFAKLKKGAALKALDLFVI